MGFPIHLRKTEQQLLFIFPVLMYIRKLFDFFLKALKRELNFFSEKP